MSAQHTPGPWTVSEYKTRHYHEINSPSGILAQTCGFATPEGRAESLADARLIAAAPELLAALRATWEQLQRDETPMPADLVEQAAAAIAKAVKS